MLTAIVVTFVCMLCPLAASAIVGADSVGKVAEKEQRIKSNSSQYLIQGIVRDSISLEPLPYATVTVPGLGAGAVTDDKGIFQLTLPDNADTLIVYFPGYVKKTMSIKKNRVNMYAIDLTPSKTMLREVVITKKKYSKKNNPAVDFVRKLRDRQDLTDPKRNQYYNYDKYERITIALNNFAQKEENSWMFRKFPFLWEHVDTSEISGKPILNVSFREKASSVHFRRSPKAHRELVDGINFAGIDELADAKSMERFFEDVLQEVDLYDNDITLLQNKFVSPLSRIAPDFYKFYLTDTVKVGDERCVVLSFYPHNKASFGFIGQLYVPVGDSTMFVKKVSMRIPSDINLNFIENLYLSQEFARAPDGSRLKLSDDLVLEVSVIPGAQGLYARRGVAYKNHSFAPPADADELFSGLQEVKETDGARERDEVYWEENRQFAATGNESSVASLMERLRKVPVFYWGEKFLKIMVNGYINTGKKSKFDIGPVNTTISFNTLEGMRLRAGGMTTANLSKRWFARGYAAYGFKDHKWKYRGEIEYSFVDKDYHSQEFPIHSLRLTSLYDVDMLGQHYLFTNPDNVFLSLKRMSDHQMTYHRVNKLEYTLELHNNFSVIARIQNEQQQATQWMPFVDGYGNSFSHYDETSLQIQLRFAPGEKFYQTKSYRIPITLDAPVVVLTHTVAPRGLFNSRYTLNTTELSVQKRFWFSAFGYTDIIVKGGHCWSRTPYPNLLIPNANLSYTIQPESFALMNPMEFINDSYVSWDLTYWANGALFNLVPYLKRLKLREAVAFRGIYGSLSDRNNPTLNPTLFAFPSAATATPMKNGPYMEISAGIDNILKCLRLDYVWRLNYLNVPYPIDRHGLRLAFHATF